MTLNETHICELLDQATPGPWNVATFNLYRTDVIDNEHAVANRKLAALAPELAQDWLRMRNDLGHLARILEEFAASPDAVPAVPVETFAAHLIHQILNWELSNDHY